MAYRDTKCALQRIQLDAVAVEVVERLAYAVNECGFLLGFDDHVVHIDLDVLADLVLEAGLHAPLAGGTRVLQSEGRGVVAVDTIWCDKGRFLLVLNLHHDLIVASVGVEK